MKRSYLFVLLAGLIGFGLAYLLNSQAGFEWLTRQAQDAQVRAAAKNWFREAHADGGSVSNATANWSGSGGRCKVVIVAIDDDTRTLLTTGKLGPFEARVDLISACAKILPKLKDWGADRVGFAFALGAQLQLTQRLSLGSAMALRDAVVNSGLPIAVLDNDGATLQLGAAITAPCTLAPDADGVQRVYPLMQNGQPTFALALVRLLDGDKKLRDNGWLEDTKPRAEQLRLAYTGPAYTIPRVSLARLLQTTPEAGSSNADLSALFRGRTVLIGPTSAPGDTIHRFVGFLSVPRVKTPFYNTDEERRSITRFLLGASSAPDATLSDAVEIHATAVQMLLEPRSETYFSVAAESTNVQILAATCLFMVLVVALTPPFVALMALVIVTLGLWFGSEWALVVQRTMFDPMGPTLGALITFGFGIGASFLAERREKRLLFALFGKYVSKEVVAQLAKSADLPKLGGEKRELTVMFTDLAGFTAWSERLEPEQLVIRLNEYFSAMSSAVMAQSGTLDKFIGDAIMAFWNAPVARKDHAARACDTALLMIQRLEDLNARWKQDGLGTLRMRIGINTGPAVVGHVGSGDRFDYTALGDVVNLASRLEGTGKFYGVSCVISAATLDAAGRDKFVARQLDRVRVVGRGSAVDVFELIGTKTEVAADAALREFLQFYDEGVQAYFQRKWRSAQHAFVEAQKRRPDDPPVKMFLARLQRFAREVPPSNWDGSVELPTK